MAMECGKGITDPRFSYTSTKHSFMVLMEISFISWSIDMPLGQGKHRMILLELRVLFRLSVDAGRFSVLSYFSSISRVFLYSFVNILVLWQL